MARHYESSAATCPFYRGEGRMILYCEGVANGCSTHLAFALAQSAAEYKEAFCRKDWHECKIAQTLWSIYENQERGTE